jgi:hypothetical protein
MGMKQNRFRLAGLLLFNLGGWAVVDASPGATELDPVAPLDACALLSSREIEHVVNRRVEAPEHQDAGYVDGGAYSSACIWIIPGTSSPRESKSEESKQKSEAPMGGRDFVILHAMRWQKGMAHIFLDDFYAAAKRGELPHEPGSRKIGDDALWWGDGVAVRKGDVSYGISVFVAGMRLDEAGRIEEILARHIVPRVSN